MKKEELSDAMEYVDEKLLVAAEEARGTKQKKKTGALRFAGLAASCALTAAAANHRTIKNKHFLIAVIANKVSHISLPNSWKHSRT